MQLEFSSRTIFCHLNSEVTNLTIHTICTTSTFCKINTEDSKAWIYIFINLQLIGFHLDNCCDSRVSCNTESIHRYQSTIFLSHLPVNMYIDSYTHTHKRTHTRILSTARARSQRKKTLSENLTHWTRSIINDQQVLLI